MVWIYINFKIEHLDALRKKYTSIPEEFWANMYCVPIVATPHDDGDVVVEEVMESYRGLIVGHKIYPSEWKQVGDPRMLSYSAEIDDVYALAVRKFVLDTSRYYPKDAWHWKYRWNEYETPPSIFFSMLNYSYRGITHTPMIKECGSFTITGISSRREF